MATYYVKNSGNNSYSGLSDSSAWSSIDHVRTIAFAPGDYILFKRGDTWVTSDPAATQSLVINTYAGSLNLPITYGAYGTGNKPIITGKQSFSGWDVSSNWTNISGNVWSTTGYVCGWALTQNNRGRIWLNDVEVQKVQDNTTFVPTSTYPWTHNSGTLYVYATSNPATYYSNIEWTGPVGYVMTCSVDNIIFQNLDLRGTEIVATIDGGNNIIVEDCVIGIDTAMTGMIIKNSNNSIIRNNTFETGDVLIDTYSFNNTEEGLAINDGCDNIDIYGNIFKDWSHASFLYQTNNPTSVYTTFRSRNNNIATLTYGTSNEKIIAGSRVTISNMVDASYNGIYTVLSTPTSTSITYSNSGSNESNTVYVGGVINLHEPITNSKFRYNISSGSNVDYGRAWGYNIRGDNVGDCIGNETYNNYFYDHKTSNQISGDGVKFYNNIIDGVWGSAYSPYQATGIGLAIGNYYGWCRNNEVYNNTFLNCAAAAIQLPYSNGTTMGGYAATYLNNRIINNIIYNCGSNSIDIRWSPGVDKGNTYNTNLIYDPSTSVTIFYEKMVSAVDRERTVLQFNAMDATTAGMFSASDAPYYIQEVSDNIVNNISGNPLFVNISSSDYLLRDYRLSAASPAIGAGSIVSITTDSLGLSYANPPSIGAYEFFDVSTYFVKNTGNDNWNGLSDASAWATLDKVNTAVLKAGDVVLFNRGDKWTVTQSDFSDGLNINTYSGSANLPIIYGAYGTGIKPIITGRQSIAGWDVSSNWTNSSTNIWSMATNITSNLYQYNNRGRLWLNGVEAKKANSTTTPTLSLPWCNNNQTIYVYATSNPATYYTNIESVGVYPAVLICDQDFITFENIDFQGGGNEIQFLGDDITFDNCNIGMYCGQVGLGSIYPPGAINNLTIKNSIFDTGDVLVDNWMLNNSEDGILLSDGGDNWQIYNNVFKSWGHVGANIGTYNSTPVTNVKFHHNSLSAPVIDYGHSFGFGNDVSTFGLSIGNEIYNNYFFDYPTQLELNGDGFKFYNNIIDGVRGSTYSPYDTWSGEGVQFATFLGSCCNIEFYNNIIMNTRDYGIWMKYANSGLYQHNLFKNNILYNCGYGLNDSSIAIRIDLCETGVMLDNTYQNNLIYNAFQTDVIRYDKLQFNPYITVAEFNERDGSSTGMWPGEIADVINNNIQLDPIFIDSSNAIYELRNYRLQSSSPAIHTGTYVGLLTDFDGSLWNNPPSIGAFEYSYSPDASTSFSYFFKLSNGQFLTYNGKYLFF